MTIGLDCLQESAISEVNRFDASDIANKVASEINDFNPEDYMDPRDAGLSQKK